MEMETILLTAKRFKGEIDGNAINSAKVVIVGTKFGNGDSSSNDKGMNIKVGYEISTYAADPAEWEYFSKLPVPCKVKLDFILRGGKVFFTGVVKSYKPVEVNLAL